MAKQKVTTELPKGVRFKNGSYEFRKTINGMQIQISNKDLNVLLAKAEEAIQALRGGNEYKRKTYTLKVWMSEWYEKIKFPKVKETSRIAMLRLAQRTFIKYLGDIKVKDLSSLRVQEAVNQMVADGIKESQVRKALSNFRECMDFAVANRLIDVNPTVQVDMPWQMKRTEEEIPLSREEQQILLEQIKSERNWYEELIYVAILEGCRIGELGSLTWANVDFKNEIIKIESSLSITYLDGIKTIKKVEPKTAAGYRTIPMLSEAKEMLLRQKQKVDSLKKQLGKRWRAPKEFGDLVFVTTLGSPVTRYVFEKELNKIVDRINETRDKDNQFRHIYPHLLRHTFCTRCFEAGVSPKTVQAWAGHSSYNVTMTIYSHVTQETSKKEADKVPCAYDESYLEKSGKSVLPEITCHSHI